MVEQALSAPTPLARLAQRVRHRIAIEWRKRTYVRRDELGALATLSGSASNGSSSVLKVHVRSLGGTGVEIRPNTSDREVLWATFVGQHHLVPREIDPRTVRVIWDLGANIGLTAAHFAARYPAARVFAVELCSETAEAAIANTKPWSDRCTIIRGAVWYEDGQVNFQATPGDEEAAHIVEDPTQANEQAPAYSLNKLFADHPVVDYVKFDIEGAEVQVLRRNTEWAKRVRSVKVEVHTPYTIAECRADLEALGFRTRIEPSHWASVVGFR